MLLNLLSQCSMRQHTMFLNQLRDSDSFMVTIKNSTASLHSPPETPPQSNQKYSFNQSIVTAYRVSYVGDEGLCAFHFVLSRLLMCKRKNRLVSDKQTKKVCVGRRQLFLCASR